MICPWLTVAALPMLAARVASVSAVGTKTPGAAVMTWLALSALISKASAWRNRCRLLPFPPCVATASTAASRSADAPHGIGGSAAVQPACRLRAAYVAISRASCASVPDRSHRSQALRHVACMKPGLCLHSPAAAHDAQPSFSSLHSSIAVSCCAPADAASKKGRRSGEAADREQKRSSVGSLITRRAAAARASARDRKFEEEASEQPAQSSRALLSSSK